jgi:hypothetical protein
MNLSEVMLIGCDICGKDSPRRGSRRLHRGRDVAWSCSNCQLAELSQVCGTRTVAEGWV